MAKELLVSYTTTEEEILLPKRDALLGMAMAELDKTDVDGEVVDRALDWSWALLDLKEEHRHMYTHLAIVAAEADPILPTSRARIAAISALYRVDRHWPKRLVESGFLAQANYREARRYMRNLDAIRLVTRMLENQDSVPPLEEE